MTLAPRIEGVVPIRSSAWQFVPAFRHRAAAGLLLGRPHARSNYQVVEEGADVLRIRAADYWTAIAVGLNDLELRLPSSGRVQYRVLYWRWALYALGLCGVLGLTGFVLLLMPNARDYVAREVTTWLPGLSLGQKLYLAWTMVLFWGFVWPWVLIALHKKPLRRLIERLVREVDAQASNSGRAEV
jgi:hypothetical protein